MKSRILVTMLALAIFCCSAAAQETTAVPVLSAEVQVCTSITERMPDGADSTFAVTTAQLYCWSKITGAGADGATVTHIWLHDGKEMCQVDLQVKASPWRTWSVKNLYGMAGNWEVRVVDAEGKPIGAAKFKIE